MWNLTQNQSICWPFFIIIFAEIYLRVTILFYDSMNSFWLYVTLVLLWISETVQMQAIIEL